jgi:hypothetical protein
MQPPPKLYFVGGIFNYMKHCPKCKEEKDPQEFSKNRKRKDGLQTECKMCRAIYLKDHYGKNKSKYKSSALRSKMRNRKFVQESKHMMPCKDCKVRYPYYVMDYDHRDPKEKYGNIGFLVKFSRAQIVREMKKCDLVCSNCHRERTYGSMVKQDITRVS